MRRMKAATVSTALGYVCLLSCFGNLALRTASSSRRTRRLRPDGLSPLGIRDTGQNASQVQDAFRSLHYVAEATCRPPLIPTVTTISAPHFGDRPHVTWAPKTVLKNVIFGLIISSYLKMSRKRRVGAWKVSEDKRFVMVIVAVLGDRFEEGGVGARSEDELEL